MSKKIDYIIVGQGLAGSALAVQLLLRGKKIMVLDNPSGNNTSSVAAGIFNPLTGNKMIRTWKADLLFPYLNNFYKRVEDITSEKFFHTTPLYRPFLSIQEQNEW